MLERLFVSWSRLLRSFHSVFTFSFSEKATNICSIVLMVWPFTYKNFRNRPYGFDIYYVNVKALRTIAQIFVAFSKKLNFTQLLTLLGLIFVHRKVLICPQQMHLVGILSYFIYDSLKKYFTFNRVWFWQYILCTTMPRW